MTTVEEADGINYSTHMAITLCNQRLLYDDTWKKKNLFKIVFKKDMVPC